MTNPYEYEYTGMLQPWLDEIISLHEEGKTPTEIRDHIWPAVHEYYKDHTYYYYPGHDTVKYILRRYGLLEDSAYRANMAASNAKKREVLKLYNEGHTVVELSKRYGVTKSRIYLFLKDGRALVARDKAREEREKILDSIYSLEERYNLEVKQATSKGRPIDMGGPRDVWIDCELWEVQWNSDI